MEAELETKVLDRGSERPAQSEAPEDPRPDAKVVGFPGVGTAIGRYELLHRLGHGGMATVHLGRATGRAGFERLVAVKVIHPHLANEPEFVEMFLDEARIAARIHHPHVVAIHDVGEADGTYFMVMEYVEGETLAALVRQLRKLGENLPLSAVLQIAADACEGLAAAHDLADPDGAPFHLVHRDVSPHNLLVGMDGRVKVVDFGIMKAAGKRSSTLTGQLRGKLGYMSPEQARGSTIDLRTDVFALGAVIWELLTNRRLFVADSESETLERVLRCEVPPLTELRPDVPPSCVALVERALQRDPERRYASATDMLRDIRAALRGLESSLDPREDLARVMQRHFTARIEYVRAAVRNREQRTSRSSDELAAASASQAARRSGLHDDMLTTPAKASRVGEAPAEIGGNTGTATLSHPVAVPAGRHWSTWILLPLVGAAIGTATVGLINRSRSAEEVVAQPITTPPPAEPAPAAAAPAAAPLDERVTWYINTDPQGATVTIDGRRFRDVTPMSVDLAKSDRAVLIVLEREGYKESRYQRAPLETDNLDYLLEQQVLAHPAVQTAPDTLRLRPVGPRKPAAKETKTDDPKPPAATPDGRTFEAMPPDWETESTAAKKEPAKPPAKKPDK